MSKTVDYAKFDGGLSKIDSTNIGDNQFEVATNFEYSSQYEIKTRRGISQFSLVPDTIVLVDDCEDTTDWTAGGDATNLTQDTTNEIRGTACLNFDVGAFSSGSSTLTLAAAGTVDITTTKDYLGFWVKFPTGYTALLTDIKIRIGSDSSNYYWWTMTNPTAATATFIKLNFADATTVGTPNDAAIDYFSMIIATAASYAGYEEWLVDDIRAYSATSTKPVTSIFSHKIESTGVRWLICVSGTNMMLYNETNSCWEQINSGLTEFETGSTTNRTKWSFSAYKDIVYMANGVDYYRWWDGTTVANGAGILGRYLLFAKARMHIAGLDTAPEVVYYTSLLPTDAQTFASNYGVGSQGEGRINSLHQFGETLLVFKGKQVYALDVSTTPDTTTAISMQNGGYSDRVTTNIGNGLLYETEAGIENLVYKFGTTGAQAIETEEFTKNLRKLTRDIAPRQYNSNVGYYARNITNFYWQFDTNDDYSPDTTLVYSALVGAWTQAQYPEIYHFSDWEKSDGSVVNLAASANGGIIYQINSGYDDDGVPIEYELLTKNWDFGDIGTRKEFEFVDLMGRKSEGNNIDVEIFVDGESVATAEITDDNLLETSTSNALADNPISDEPIGGGAIEAQVNDELEMFPYLIRMYIYGDGTGQRLQVKMSSNTIPIQWTLNKARIDLDDEIIFSEQYIA